jgi:hypothetical protein
MELIFIIHKLSAILGNAKILNLSKYESGSKDTIRTVLSL